jgi:DNA-dependent metalloprotease WSS1
MPLNTLRLNHQKSTHPNDLITFIKPLRYRPSSDRDFTLALTFLRAIAAQCLPIMKKHHLSIVTLEEHEPNNEFIGCNYNGGEIIQLVLKSHDGRWLSFNSVQLVMMHELAHNTHQNHGKGFWQTRDEYVGELRDLWKRKYTGEGFWGSGQTLNEMGSVMGNNIMRPEELNGLQACGGTYRSRQRKRRVRGPELSWKEKQERRIERKFGKSGVALGEDEDKRMTLELSRRGPVGGKPRVAQSKRGRELRAAAALARFDTNKKEIDDLTSFKNEDEDEYEDLDADKEDARDSLGRKILDGQGRGMIRICGKDDGNQVFVKKEMDELNTLDRYFDPFKANQSRKSPTAESKASKATSPSTISAGSRNGSATPARKSRASMPPQTTRSTTTKSPSSSSPAKAPTPPSSGIIPCQICSLANDRMNATCTACAHVIDPRKEPRHWACQSASCKRSDNRYLNAGDSNVCGVCWTRRS